MVNHKYLFLLRRPTVLKVVCILVMASGCSGVQRNQRAENIEAREEIKEASDGENPKDLLGTAAEATSPESIKSEGTVRTSAGVTQNPSPVAMTPEQMSQTMARMQLRIDELEAKLANLKDHVDAANVSVENIAGPLKIRESQRVGSLAQVESDPKAGSVLGGNSSHSAAANEISGAGEKATPLTLPMAVSRDESSRGRISAVSSPSPAVLSKGMSLFRKRQYSEAIIELSAFVKSHPSDVFAGVAQYYTGESYFRMGEFKLAIPEFRKVVDSFDGSARLASSLQRLSQCYEQLGNADQAAYWAQQAKQSFGDHPGLELQIVSNQIKEIEKTETPEKRQRNPSSFESQTEPEVLPVEPDAP